MSNIMNTFSLTGIRLKKIQRFFDERGFFAEVLRSDWHEILEEDTVVQVNLSMTFPGIVRAWHRHTRGQVDYMLPLRGALKICAYDDEPGSPSQGCLFQTVQHGEGLTLVRIPGHYWHGIMAVGHEPAWLIYFVTRLYDENNPDEERRPWNDPSIIDPSTNQAFDWFRDPHR